MTTTAPVLRTDLTGIERINEGKVRDLYAVGDDLLMVTTDRISAYDVVLPSGIPDKGRVLTQLSVFWFDHFKDKVANHLVTADPGAMPESCAPHAAVLDGRSMLCRRLDMVPVECVARGHLAGSGWKEYKESGTVCGIPLPDGLRESDRLPEPIFTPATKAEQGEHDENISFERMVEIIGADKAETLRDLTLDIYRAAAEHAAERGIILADTKFEFGWDDSGPVLADEVLTPDSSRFWPADDFEPGRSQASFDKQYVRDWLTDSGWDRNPPAPELPDDVVERTSDKYREAYRLITGRELGDA